jgi:hypothetical protein
MLTWFQAGLIMGKDPYKKTYLGGHIADPRQHFLDCTGAETPQDYTDFKAGVEAYRECLGGKS